MTAYHTPNLFSYATSELSQDAFICWLAAWADPKYKEDKTGLHAVAQNFVTSLIHKHKQDYDFDTVKTVDVERQVEKLDVLIEINKELESKLAILIEDKTHTDHHSGQLGRYYDNVTKKYTEDQVVPIYFKTGYQSKFDVSIYKTYLRKEFLQLLKEGGKIDNAIYADFLTHLENMESAVNQFLFKELYFDKGGLSWDNHDRRGFFMHLYDIFSKTDSAANWGYVPNASGGFFGFWWDFACHKQDSYWTYLQLEGDKLCYKIGLSDKIHQAPGWESKAQVLKLTWVTTLKKLDKELTNKYTKIGKTMTVARKADASSYFLLNTDGTSNLDGTITKLQEAQSVLEKARQLLTVSEQ